MVTLGQLLGGRPDLQVPDVLLHINANRLRVVHPDKDLDERAFVDAYC